MSFRAAPSHESPFVRRAVSLLLFAAVALGVIWFGYRFAGASPGKAAQRAAAESRHADGHVAGVASPPLYRCHVDGKVTYSTEPSDCGRPPRPVAAAPLPSAAPPVEAGPTAYQREMLRSADARIARQNSAWRTGAGSVGGPTSPSPTPPAPTRTAATTATPSSTAGCASLSSRLQSIDSAARQPRSSSAQDDLRADRRAVTSAQHAAGC